MKVERTCEGWSYLLTSWSVEASGAFEEGGLPEEIRAVLSCSGHFIRC